MVKNKRVLFLVPYPLHRAPSQRFRVELFFPLLTQNSIEYKVQSFLDDKTWEVLYQKGSPLQKAWGVVKGFLRRTKCMILDVPQYDYIFIHREASPIGPPIFEFILSRIWKKKVIYDFDDAIWIPNTTAENKLVKWFKAAWKVQNICRWAHTVVGGNAYLCAFAKQYNQHVRLIPTCVDMERKHNQLKAQEAEKIVIGWTGSHSTMPYLDSLVPVLRRIVRDFNVEVVIISNKAPDFDLPSLTFIPWKEESEIKDLLQMHIGIMPLENDPWSEGKCGFKLIQYLALGIPSVASPVGVNQTIIEAGENGFLCTNDAEWYDALAVLIQDEELRKGMGLSGREKVQTTYSLQANAGAFLELFT
jgi:glycosyltransferase involved in cell wall biosynthesis